MAKHKTIERAQKIELPAIAAKDLDLAESGNIRSMAMTLKAVIHRSYSLMAHLLYRAKKEKLYEDWGFESFADYVRSELGFSIRKADYLVQIYESLALKYNIGQETLDQIGWTKAKELVHIIDEGNKDDLIEDAKEMSFGDLKERLFELQNGKSNNREHFRKINFTLSSDQVDNLDHALSLAADICKAAGKPSLSKNHLIDMIALEFASGNLDKAQDDSLGTYIEALERRFGGKLIFFKNENMAKAVLEVVEKSVVGEPAEETVDSTE